MTYRKWRITYTAGLYTAEKYGTTMNATSRVDIEREVDKFIYENKLSRNVSE